MTIALKLFMNMAAANLAFTFKIITITAPDDKLITGYLTLRVRNGRL